MKFLFFLYSIGISYLLKSSLINGFTPQQRNILFQEIEVLVRKEPIDFVGAVVRLAFHDSGTYDPKTKSGPDGCIDYRDPGNNGLQKVTYS